jgi:two-component system phosphate regulon response regulator PhoB
MTTISVITSSRPLVLFVDDESALQKQVTAYLSTRGMDVVAVSDGDAALSAVRERRPDIVCVDVKLPRMSGYEVCEAIRSDAELAGIVVLMTSRRVSLEARAYSYEAGANGYLAKPYSMEQLAREVTRLLDPARDDGAELALRLA